MAAATSSSGYQDSTADSLALANQVLSNRQSLRLNNFAYASAAAATSVGTPTGVKIVNTVNYMLNGAWQTAITATDPFWTLSGVNVPIGSVCVFMLGVTSGGTAAVVQSSLAATAATVNWNLSGSATTSQFDGFSIFASVAVAVGTTASGAFVPGTTNLTATGITPTYFQGPDPNFLPVLSDANGGLQVWRAKTGPSAYL